ILNKSSGDPIGDGGPQKTPALKTLGEQTRALSVVPDDLDQIASATAEDPQIAGMRIAFERFLHQKRQRAESFAHVGMAGREPHPRAARKCDHHRRSRAFSAPMTRVSVAASGAPLSGKRSACSRRR